ncbi:DNA-binding protein [Paraburkholderia kururiensis]
MKAFDPQIFTYLDAYELAELLGVSVRTIVLRAKHRPWLLPPRAQLSEYELLRWRRDVAHAWLRERDE